MSGARDVAHDVAQDAGQDGRGVREVSVLPRRTDGQSRRVCPHGPLLVRGASTWPGPDGDLVEVDRPVVAVCRCLKSSRLPWCDGTHQVVPRGWDATDPQSPPRPRASEEGGEAPTS